MMALAAAGLLPPGSRVAVVAPAGPVPEERLRRGLDVLRGRFGLDVWVSPASSGRSRYLAGSDAERLEALASAWLGAESASFDAVWVARGGYGCTRLLRSLPAAIEVPEEAPLLLGFSDVTALLAWGQQRGGATLHAPVVTQLAELDEASLAWLQAAFGGEPPSASAWAGVPHVLRPGRAVGPLRGGNLTVLAALAGTPWAWSLAGALVLLEDVAEPAYRVDRAVRQLEDACGLRGAAGVLLGTFSGAGDREEAWIADFWREWAEGFSGPVLWQVPVGHTSANVALPMGGEATLDTSSASLSLRWPGPRRRGRP